MNRDCNHYVRKRICVLNTCECGFDYVLNPKTRICEKSVKNSCNTTAECRLSSDRFCINNMYECLSGYDKYNQFEDSYNLQICTLESDCNSFDKNIVCSGKECKCKSRNTLYPNNRICKMKFQKTCDSINDCDNNQFCIRNRCECKPNYVYSNITNSCEFKSFNYNSDCDQYDRHRICNTSNGLCGSYKTYYKIDTKTLFYNRIVEKRAFFI